MTQQEQVAHDPQHARVEPDFQSGPEKLALVIGGSRGFGKGIVQALDQSGLKVWALARDQQALTSLGQDLPRVRTIAADMNEAGLAGRVLGELQPDIVVLSAGSTPQMAPIQEQIWDHFSQVWENDVKATLAFGQAALLTPLRPGSQMLIVSSGAAVGGSPLSGGYAGAKRMQWLMAQYLQQEAQNLQLGIRFTVLVPRQISPDTDLGRAAIAAYTERLGISAEKYLERFGEPLTSRHVGEAVRALLLEPREADSLAFGLTSRGLEALP